MDQATQTSILKELMRQIDSGANADAGVQYKVPTSIYADRALAAQEAALGQVFGKGVAHGHRAAPALLLGLRFGGAPHGAASTGSPAAATGGSTCHGPGLTRRA